MFHISFSLNFLISTLLFNFKFGHFINTLRRALGERVGKVLGRMSWATRVGEDDAIGRVARARYVTTWASVMCRRGYCTWRALLG